MVRIQREVSKKHYLKTKRAYEYERLSLDIPKKFHEIIRPWLKKDLDVNIILENDTVTISLKPRQNISDPRKQPREN